MTDQDGHLSNLLIQIDLKNSSSRFKKKIYNLDQFKSREKYGTFFPLPLCLNSEVISRFLSRDFRIKVEEIYGASSHTFDWLD